MRAAWCGLAAAGLCLQSFGSGGGAGYWWRGGGRPISPWAGFLVADAQLRRTSRHSEEEYRDFELSSISGAIAPYRLSRAYAFVFKTITRADWLLTQVGKCIRGNYRISLYR